MNKGKVISVTGAARGIGRGISLTLAEAGYTIVAVGTRPESDVSEYIRELNRLSADSVYIRADISDEGDQDSLVAEIGRRFGNLHFHVNNAGIAPSVRADILETTPESFDRLISVNLRGTFFLTQKIAGLMIKSGGDAVRGIINISSISAYTSSINRAEYCISKAGISMITTLFADRLAEYGVNVYEIRPGIIETDMTAGVSEKYNRLIDGGLLPIKRMGKPEDIGKTVLAIADGALPYSTGEVINADGGFHIRKL